MDTSTATAPIVTGVSPASDANANLPGMAGASTVQPTVPSQTTIDSSLLGSTTESPYTVPTPTTVPDVSTLGTPYANTQPEQNASDLSTQLENLNNEMTGKAGDTTTAMNAAGLPALNATQTDLSSQLLTLTNAAKAIPNQLQIDATGRGMTAQGLAPIQTAQLRENSIQALTVSALLAATKGQIATATANANAAVAAKYDPIQAAITAAQANLKLIMASPDYTQSEKQQAQQQADAQTAKQAALNTAVQNSKDVNAIALKAAENGADSATLQAITQATDQQSAIAAAGKYMQTSAGVTTSVQTINGQKVLIDSKTGQTIKVLGSAANPDTASQTLKNDASTVGTQLAGRVGTDGFISPQDWQTALTAWTKEGYSEASFLTYFKNYANPNDSYVGVTKASTASTPAGTGGFSFPTSTTP
jgi:hypothetical protein